MSVESELTSGAVADKVRSLLAKYPETRDNDKLLWLSYCVVYRGLRNFMTDEQYQSFKNWLMLPHTPMFESLSRARRKLQENNPELRGDGYLKKKDSANTIRDWARE